MARWSEEVPFDLLNSDWQHSLSQTQSYSGDVTREGLRSVRVAADGLLVPVLCSLISVLERRVRTAVFGRLH